MFDGLQPSFREFLNSLQVPILRFGREKLQAGNFHILNICGGPQKIKIFGKPKLKNPKSSINTIE